ncbi:hypothetical protein TNCV_348431 [Trichonephila clavipes]|nr:hypothetical protein TNCV_348431 [Trichonephila clavipes]
MAEPSKHTSRLFLLDRKSGQKFLIDSGSEICVIPPSPTMNKSPQSNFSLFAANTKFQPMGSKGKKDSKHLNWSSGAITTFQSCKQALADCMHFLMILHLLPRLLHVDASDYAIGGALHQVVDS